MSDQPWFPDEGCWIIPLEPSKWKVGQVITKTVGEHTEKPFVIVECKTNDDGCLMFRLAPPCEFN